MDFDFFKRAVDSLVEFPGMVGMIGGEPHASSFARMAEYLAQTIPDKIAAASGPQFRRSWPKNMAT